MTMRECYEAIGGNYEAVLGARIYAISINSVHREACCCEQ